ncbi:putative non-specific serine/threonine protein kinase [Helianthus annuus]|uniref:Non-specific serine/threonine protein kinase n=1 Tax=Helianthus annuus TaxID=4232 RepID=A0A9K3I3V9_HELAN|nr:putative non-specific serine/threonine protein kinase [Helianthus annuus]KAJ0532923.1 putative non-specific serine/threonine protein kinase [Helianthus annuus]KAJ0891891.1 putative non-specific serine/threonine protein kinase [Helianthus annuus]
MKKISGSATAYDPDRLPDTGNVNVTGNCSCGNRKISKDYGLFLTYPLWPEETLDSISSAANLSSDLIRSYNPDTTFSQGSGLIYIPWRDENGNYPPFKTSEPGLSGGTIGGITIGIVAVLLFLAGCLYIGVCRKKSAEMLQNDKQAQLTHVQGINIDISVEFSYEELSTATQDFSLANKIGQGGFGVVYYAELRGEKVAIKKMDMQASRQFLTELKRWLI